MIGPVVIDPAGDLQTVRLAEACTLDAIGRGEAWRSIEGWITRPFVDVDPASLPWVRYGVLSDMPAPPGLFDAVGWSP